MKTFILCVFIFIAIVAVKSDDAEKTVLLSSGHKMPVVGLGTGSIKDGGVITNALENGYKHIDTAFYYKNEKEIGKSLKKFFDKGAKREDVFITSKLPFFGNRPGDVEKYVKLSLKDLGLDYIDMYLIHGPIPMKVAGNGLTELEKDGRPVLEQSIDLVGIWKEMENQVKAGRVKSIGVSNFNKSQLATVYNNAEIKPSNLQVETHVYLQQRALREFCKKHNIVVTAYHPLGSQARKANSPNALSDPFENSVIQELAQKYKKTPAQILLRHGIQGGLIVIPKSSNIDRMKSNIDIFDFKLTDDEMAKIDALDQGEKGRVYDFKGWIPGLEIHPFYPFRNQEIKD